jgi:hypothetical protein
VAAARDEFADFQSADVGGSSNNAASNKSKDACWESSLVDLSISDKSKKPAAGAPAASSSGGFPSFGSPAPKANNSSTDYGFGALPPASGAAAAGKKEDPFASLNLGVAPSPQSQQPARPAAVAPMSGFGGFPQQQQQAFGGFPQQGYPQQQAYGGYPQQQQAAFGYPQQQQGFGGFPQQQRPFGF